MRLCLDCGDAIERGSRCRPCERDREKARNEAEPWRVAYSSTVYRNNRRAVIEAAGGICTRELPNGRCRIAATEANHLVPLSTASDYDEALALCATWNLEAVCSTHNPRGGAR